MLFKKCVSVLCAKQNYLFTSIKNNSSSTSQLAKLRKKTGYTFANCKKALDVNNNDVVLAEKWLKEQAQALGWSKLAKLEGRKAAQGLIGITVKDNNAVMIEVNCETDFVARNKNFMSLVQTVSQTCIHHVSSLDLKKPLSLINLEGSELSSLKASDGKPLSDHNALAVSNLGENLVLRRAVGLNTNGKFYLTGYAHPSSTVNNEGIYTGKYGVILAYTAPSNQNEIQQTAKQICQHIVGMNPVKIGVLGEDQPCENKDDETVMIHQEFLLDPNITVSQVISDVGIELIQFIRYECGQELINIKEQDLQQAFSH